jgi:hypothetical protein
MPPRTARSIAKLKESGTSNKALVQDERDGVGAGFAMTLYGLPVFVSSQLAMDAVQGTATNASSI